MMDTSIDGKVQRFQAMLYAKASKEPEIRFKRLYKYLTRRHWIEAAVAHVLRSQGSRTPGVDGMTRTDVQDEVERERLLIEPIMDELKMQTYKPQPARRTYIPKANGKMRPLGIPTLKDRVVQQMTRALIEPILEARFLPCSYGFRPNRCAWDALAEIHHYLRYPCLYYTVIEGDIRDCFGSIKHARLMREMRRYILDDRILTLIWGMLKAGVMENLRFYETDEGSPQGGIISPLLANVYMHALDEWFHTRFHAIGTRGRQKLHRTGELAFVRYTRYADDFTILMRCNDGQAMDFKQELFAFVDEELKMVLSEEKTLITQATEGFDFLGVRTFVVPLRRDPNRHLPYQEPSAKSVRNYRRKVKELTGSSLDYLEPAERIRSLNRLIRGWANYHRWGNAKSTFGELGYWTSKRVYRMLQRCSPGLGKRAAYRKHIKPVAVCDNLQRWQRYSQWHTPSVELGDGYRLGLLPMGIISTASYWRYRGSKIPSAFPLIETSMEGIVRGTSFYTADQAVKDCLALQWRNENPDTLYLLRRQEVFRRDDHTCTECGYRSQRKKGEVHDLECHHIDPDGGHAMENLCTVCIPCHQRLTAGQASRTEP